MPSATRPKSARRLRVGFVLSKSFTLSAFSLFVDTLRLASDERDRSGRVNCDWEVLGESGRFIRSSCGVQIVPTAPFRSPGTFDYLVVVGGLLCDDTPVSNECLNFLKDAAAKKVGLIGLCTGSFILAEAGLMRGQTACVSWLHNRDYQERFPGHRVISSQIFHVEGNRATCAGGSSCADLAAFIVRRHLGRQAERNALEILQIKHARDALDRQARCPLGLAHVDTRIDAALQFMDLYSDRRVPLEKVAAEIGMSRRQMERLFKTQTKMSPAEAYTNIRLQQACRLLAETDAPLIDIALETGYDSSASFSRNFKARYGVTPTQMRKATAGKGAMVEKNYDPENGIIGGVDARVSAADSRSTNTGVM